MRPSTASQETFFAPESPETGQVFDFMEAHAAKTGERPAPQFFLSSPEPGDQVQLPPEIYEVLVKAVGAMRQGMAITITPSSMTLTTQQAAELLGVTRPTVVRLLDEGCIPFEKPGTHRRIKLEDVVEYKEKRRAAQYSALDALGTIDDEDRHLATERTKRARTEAARRRRSA